MIAMNPDNEAILEILADAGVKVVTTSARSPKAIYPKLEELIRSGKNFNGEYDLKNSYQA
nr:hypothetical protein [uncultured Desulfobacter sp.]